MDVCGLFIGDTTLSYGSMRSSLYRDYEKFPYGTFENNRNPTIKDYYSKVQEKCQQVKEQQQKKTKQSCPFCRENKKRPLVNYMRKRDVHKHKDSICEEEEEAEVEEGQEQVECAEEIENHSDEDNATQTHSRAGASEPKAKQN